jgi:hypothetical protein
MIKYLALIFLCLIATSCYNNYKSTGSGFAVPKGKWKKYKSLKKPFTLTDTTFVSSRAIYLDNDNSTLFKFYTDGRVLIANAGNDYNFLMTPYEHIDNGYAGFYRLDSNQLTIQLWYAQMGWFDLILKGEIKNDTIIIFSDKWLNSGHNIDHFTTKRRFVEHDIVYRKTFFPLLFKEPDW